MRGVSSHDESISPHIVCRLFDNLYPMYLHLEFQLGHEGLGMAMMV